MRLLKLSKNFFSREIKKGKYLKNKFDNSNNYSIGLDFDNTYHSFTHILKKVEGSENAAFKKQIYFYYLSTFIDKINSKNKNIIFNEIGNILKLTFPCLENMHSNSVMSEAKDIKEENLLLHKKALKSLSSHSILESYIIQHFNIQRSGIRKILNNYESISDLISKTHEIKSQANEKEIKNKQNILMNEINNVKYKHKLNQDGQASNIDNGGKLNLYSVKANMHYEDKEIGFSQQQEKVKLLDQSFENNDEAYDKNILTIQQVVDFKQKNLDDFIQSENQLLSNNGNSQIYILNKEIINENLSLLINIFDHCTDKRDVYYIVKYLLDEGFSFYYFLEILKKIKQSYSRDIVEELFDHLEKNIFKIYFDFKLRNNIYAYLYKNEDISLEEGNYFDFCLYRNGVDLKSLLYSFENNTKDFLMEIKFNGKRTQMHYDGVNVKLISDKIENEKNLIFDNFAKKLEREISTFNENNPEDKIKNFILDGSMVCYSNESKKILDFKEYENLKMKSHNINKRAILRDSNTNSLTELNMDYSNDNLSDITKQDNMDYNINNPNNFTNNNNYGNDSLFIEEQLGQIMNDDYIIYETNFTNKNKILMTESNQLSSKQAVIQQSYDNNKENLINDNQMKNQDFAAQENIALDDIKKESNISYNNSNNSLTSNINSHHNEELDNGNSNNNIDDTNNLSVDNNNNINNPQDEIFVRFLAFDALHINEQNIHNLPLEKRKLILYKFFSSSIYDIAIVMGKTINLSAGGIAKNEIINYYNTAKSIDCSELVFKMMGNYTKYLFGSKSWIKAILYLYSFYKFSIFRFFFDFYF